MSMPTVGDSRKFLLLLFVVISPLISASLVLRSTASGISIGPDSVGYLSAANHLVDGSGLKLFDGKPYVDWPPLYPIVLAALKALGIDPVSSAPVINAILLAAITLVGSLWILSNVTDRAAALLGILLLTFAPPLVNISRWLYTEPLFVLWLLLSLVLLGQYGRGSSKALIGAGLLASLAWLTRYTGVTVAMTGILLLLSRGTAKRDFRNVLIYSTCAVIPGAIWMARNWLVAGTLTGERAPSEFSVLTNANRVIHVLSAWFLPETLGNMLGSFLLTAVWIVVLVAVLIFMSRSVRLSVSSAWLTAFTGRPGYPLLLFVLCYILFMLISATTVAFESLDNRMLLPLYIPLVLLLVSYVDHLRRASRHNHQRMARAVPIVLLLILTATPVYDGILNSNPLNDPLHDFNSALWHGSETISALKQSPMAATVYSDAPYAVYFLSGQPTQRSPRKRFYNSEAAPVGELEDFAKVVNHSKEPVYLVWFGWQTNFLFSLDDLQRVVELHPMTISADGTLYAVRPKKPLAS